MFLKRQFDSLDSPLYERYPKDPPRCCLDAVYCAVELACSTTDMWETIVRGMQHQPLA